MGAAAAVYRAAFRGVAGAAATADDFTIDQFALNGADPAEAAAAYNQGWIYGLEIGYDGANYQVSIDGGAN